MDNPARNTRAWLYIGLFAGLLFTGTPLRAQAPSLERVLRISQDHRLPSIVVGDDSRLFYSSYTVDAWMLYPKNVVMMSLDPSLETLRAFQYRYYGVWGGPAHIDDSFWSPSGYLLMSGGIKSELEEFFVLAVAASGEILWSARSYSSSGVAYWTRVVADSSGSVYLFGHYDGRKNFGEFTIEALLSIPAVFLAKLSSDGTVLWVKSIHEGEPYISNYALDITVGPSGNVLISIGAESSVVIIGYDSDGTEFLKKEFSDPYLPVVAYSDDRTFYAAGSFSGNTLFEGDSLYSRGGRDCIIAHYSTDGTLIDSWDFGGPYNDRIGDLIYDKTGGLTLMGRFNSEITIGDSTLMASSNNIFIVNVESNFSPTWMLQKDENIPGLYAGNIAVDDSVVWLVVADTKTVTNSLLKYSWQTAPRYESVDDFESGSATDWKMRTPSRWSVEKDIRFNAPRPSLGYGWYVSEPADLALHLNTSDITNTGEGLGEYAVLSGLLFRDFDLYAHVRSPEDLAANTFADYAVLLGYRDAENYDYVLFSAKKDESRVYRLQNGTRTALAQLDDTTIEDNNYHYIRLQRSGDTLSVWFDNRLAATVQDTGFSAGRIGFGSFNDEAWFDQVRIAGAAVRLDVGVSLPDTSVVFGDTLALPVLVSSDNPLGFAQVTLEYDSTLVDILDVAPGAATADFTFVLNRDVPFAPEHAGANANVLLQFSNSVGFSGADQEIAVLQVRSRIDADSLTGIWLDRRQPHTSFVTSDTGIEIDSSQTSFDDAALSLLARRFAISGSVKYLQSGEPISATVLHLDHLSGSSADTSDSAGAYLFPAVRADSVRLAAEKQDDQREAITGADALLSLRTLAFLDSLSPAGERTADVDENGSLTGSDAVALLRYLAFLPVAVGNPGAWRFEPPDSSFLLQNDAAVDFTGRLLGDVNLDWGSSTGAGKDTAANGRLQQTVAELRLPALVASLGDTLSLPVALSSDSGFSLLQFTLAYDSQRLQFLGARAGEATAGMTLLVNAEPPFAPQAQGVDRSLVVQFSSATDTVRGEDQIIAWLDMRVAGEADSGTVALLFDSAPERTFLTTVNYSDITGQQIQLIDGSVDITVGVQGPAGRPQAFALLQNYPNPFNPETEIRYALPRPSAVRLSLFNLTGQQVRVLVDAAQPAGWHRVRWDGRDSAGKRLPSGFYFYHLQADGFSATRRLLLLR